jgi:amino acid efflux transporter
VTRLAASITLPQAVALYLGAVVGAGVLILPGVAASIAGPASVVAWAFDSLLGLPLALTFARLASAYPDPGGVASFTRRAFGPTPGAIVGWFYLIASIGGQVIVTLTGGYYVALATGTGRAGAFLVAAVILASTTAANLRGLRVSATLQLLLSGGVVVLLLLAAGLSLPRWDAANWTPFAPSGLGAVGHAAVIIFVAVFGWEAVAQLAAEFRDPGRDVIRATLLTVGIVAVLYVGIAAATVATHTYGAAETDRTAVGQLLADSIGAPAAYAAALMAFIVATGTCNAFVAASSRLAYALARDGSLPAWFERVEGGVPRRAVAGFALGAAIGLVWLFASGGNAEILLVVPSTLGLSTYVIGTAAGVRLLRGSSQLTAFLSLAVVLALLPFAGAAVVLPVIVAVGAWLYRRLSRSRTAPAT